MEPAVILAGSKSNSLERYAARELQRCLYQLTGDWLPVSYESAGVKVPSFIIGQRHTNPLIKRLAAEGRITISPLDPGPEGYILKKLTVNGQPALIIAGSDDIGCLYGVYGLLSEHYGIGFNLTGDVFPERSASWRWVEADERKLPMMSVRGILPWSNFPQSPSSYSWEDWRFVIDGMARMRMNFLLIHNYSGERGYNEMFANFTLNGFTSRTAMATARSGHAWHGPGWDIAEYLFGAGDFFDDYDFGADCALHNESLPNEQVSQKGISLLQRVIDHAHTRGVRVALGLDIDTIPKDYNARADDPQVIAARVEQIARDYPQLDYLVCFQSEEADKTRGFQDRWRKLFMGFYEGMKKKAPRTHLVVSGWGLEPKLVAGLPPDVICAPIAKYSDQFDSGAQYGTREYWGCPWLERDQVSSQYYYPYNMDLSRTTEAYRKRAPNMKGFFALTWRLADAIEPKLDYISKAPWVTDGKLYSAAAVYRAYAEKCYGADCADDITTIINQNEPFASDFGECQGTAQFSPPENKGFFRRIFGNSPNPEYSKCIKQLDVIKKCISRTKSPESRRRLELLQHRLSAVLEHMNLNQEFQSYRWRDLPGAFDSWVSEFHARVTDISSLGNVVSLQNRFAQIRYCVKEKAFRKNQTVPTPSHVTARGTTNGAVISWCSDSINITGFNLYRNGAKLTSLPASARMYQMTGSGNFRYALTALFGTNESPLSVPSTCQAGTADRSAPQVVLISPPTSVTLGQPAAIKARLIDGRTYDCLMAVLHYRNGGDSTWKKLVLPRRVKGIFAAEIPAEEIRASGLEYYVEGMDGDNAAYYPVTGAARPLFATAFEGPTSNTPSPPMEFKATGQILSWSAPTGDIFWYKIYRSSDSHFQTGPANFLTYFGKDTTRFQDLGADYDAQRMKGTRFYRVSVQTRDGFESKPTEAVSVFYP